MYSGILTLGVSIFSYKLAVIIGYIPWLTATYLERVIIFFGSQRWSLLTLDLHQSQEYMIVSLVVLIVFILRFSVSKKS